jgi:hypothetical protein
MNREDQTKAEARTSESHPLIVAKATWRRRASLGVAFIVTTPSAWGWAMIPVVVAGSLFAGGAALAIWGGNILSEQLFALDAIARKQELALGGRTWPNQPALTGALRSLRVTLTALAIGLPILGVLALATFVFPPAAVVTVPLKFVVTGVLAAYDLLDYPLSQRGQSVADRVAFIRANFAAVLGFGVATAALLLIPGVGLFLLPFGVAGATRMVVDADR